MSGNTQKPKLLIVDTSTSMAQVLSVYAKQENHQADVFSDPAEACIALDRQADNYQCVVLGWPEGKMNIIADLISKLSEANLAQLPLVIISHGESAVADTLSKHRINTRTLLWRDYRQTTQIVDELTAFNMPERVDTIIEGLSPSVQSKESKPVKDQVLVPLAGMLEMTDEPALLINNGQQIVSANRRAMDIVAPNQSIEIFREISATKVFGDWLNLAQTKPESGKFSSISGDQFTVEYWLKKIEGISLGLEGDHYLLTFMVLDSTPAEPLPGVAAETPRVDSRTPSILSPSALEQAIDTAVRKRKGRQVVSVLMLDIKMKAAVTGDRLSLGSSEPLLEIVKESLLKQYPRQNSLAYMGEGRFAFLIETPRIEQALNLSKKIVDTVPGLVNNAVDVELVSHAAFLRMPEHSSMTADLLLKHCTAACLKSEADGKDNTIYVIGKEPWQQPAGSRETQTEEDSVLDIGIPDMPTSFRRTRSADVAR